MLGSAGTPRKCQSAIEVVAVLRRTFMTLFSTAVGCGLRPEWGVHEAAQVHHTFL